MSEYSRNDFRECSRHTISASNLIEVYLGALKPLKVERIDLSLGLTHLFCQNSDYETLELVQNGMNLEKTTTIKILQVLQWSCTN